MYRYTLLFGILLGVILALAPIRAEGGSDLERSLEEILNVFLGSSKRSETPPETAGNVYTVEELSRRYVVSRFQIILHMNPTEHELAGLAGRLTRGLMSEEELINMLFTSDEYHYRKEDNGTYLRTLFRATLNREPRLEELDLHIRLLNRGGITRVRIREKLFRDMEFRAIHTAREALARYGTVPKALGAFFPEMHREAGSLANQISRERGKNSSYLYDVKGKLKALADMGGSAGGQGLAQPGNDAYYIDMAENMRYLVYSIDKSMSYSDELDYLNPRWKDTKKLAFILLNLMEMEYGVEGTGEAQAAMSAATASSPGIELRVMEYAGTKVENSLDLTSDRAKGIARKVLDSFNEYTRGKGLSLLQEFELERSLRKVAGSRGEPRNVAISDNGRGRYVVYFLVNL